MKNKHLRLLLFVLLIPLAMWGQETLTVFDGTNWSSGVPVYSYYTNAGASSQYIISADELTPLSNGTISKVTYYCTSQSVSWGNASFKVYLGETDDEAFSGTNAMPWSEMTEVYSGNLSVSGGTMEIIFDTPYSYHGDNLVIGVNQTVNGTQGGYQSWYGLDVASGNMAWYSIYGSYYVSSTLPKTTISYVPGVATTCPKPRSLTATLTEGNGAIATLNWIEKGSATQWLLQCGTDAEFQAGTYDEYEILETPSKNLSGLTPETTYYARVKSVCSGEDQSVWSYVCSFTPSNILNLLLFDNTQTNSYVPLVAPNGFGSQFIIPAENLSAAAYGQITSLTFYSTSSTVSLDPNSYEVFLMETADGFFSGNVAYPYGDMTKVYTGGLSVNGGLMTISFSTPYYYEGGNLLVAVKEDYEGGYAYCYWYGASTTSNQALSGTMGNTLYKFLPKTTVSYMAGEVPACPRPKYFNTTNITSTSATFTWTNGGTETVWQIAYTDDANINPDDIPAANIVDVDTKPYTLGGLSGGTEYFAYIRAIVGNEHSDWSKVCNFTPFCGTPYNFGPNNVTINSASLTWINGGTESEWQIVFATDENFDPDLADPIDVTTKPYTLTGLSTDVTYYARIRAKCDVGDYSDWSEPCMIKPTCKEATNLNATILGPTSAKLSWSPGGNQSGWQIAYTDNAQTLPEDATILSVSAYPPYTLTGLTPNVTYYAYVRSDCGTEHYSDWSSVCSFTPTYILTVNDGTSYNSQVPIYGDYTNNTTQSQFIIPASSLKALENADITKLTFYTDFPSTINWGTATFNVSMKIVDQTTFSSATYDWNDTTLVYSGSLSVSNNLMEITLGKSYHYENGNLLIGFNQTVTGTSKYSYWYGVSTTSNTAIGGYGSYNYMKQFLPKMTFTYTPGVVPTCAKPSGLSISESSNSAVITWNAGNEETHWNVQYKARSVTEWSPIISLENTPTCTLSGLSPGTSYQVRVQADCGSGDVSSWVSSSFVTLCGVFNVPFEHDFDHDTPGTTAGLPLCWTLINDSESSAFQNYPRILEDETGQMHSYSSSNYMLFYSLGNYTALNQIAVLPEMDAEISTLVLSFYAKLETDQTNQKLAIGVMTDPEDASTFVKYKDVKIASSTYAQYVVDFENYSGSGQNIAIKCERGASTRYFIDDIRISQSCREPENLEITSVTTNSALFSWTSANVGANWQVQYKKSSDADWSESIAVSGTASHTFNTLLAATQYDVRIRTNCGNDNYSEWVSTSFTTDCDYMSLPYSYGFENDEAGNTAPSCWHFHGSYYPCVDDDQYNYGNAHSGQNCLLINENSNNAVNFVVLPEIDTAVTPINTLQVTFWGKRLSGEVYHYIYFDNLYLGVMTDPNDISTFQYVSGANTNISNPEYKQFELYLDNYTGEGTYLAIRYNGSPMYYIDDVEVSVAPTCRQPLDLSTNYTSAHEANIQWMTRDLRQCNYQVSYSTNEGFDPDNGTIVDVEFTSSLVNAGTSYRDYTLTCLNANTTYYYYVRANCGNSDFSEWSEDYASLTTGEACPGPVDFGAHTIKNTYAILSWYGDHDANWEFHYKKTSDEEWITPANLEIMSGEGSELRCRIDSLETNVEYIAQLRRNCGMYSCPAVDDGYSDWATYTFITSEGCQTPSAWMCLTQMGTSAKLEWNQVGEENYWQIRYRLSSEHDYPAENIVLTDYMPEARKQQWTITGLQPNSMYYWQVRAYCEEESQSNWSNEKYFFTGGEKITVDKAHPFHEDFEGTSEMPAGWMRCNQYNSDLDFFKPWSFTLAEEPAWDERPGNHAIFNNCDIKQGSTSVLTPEMHIDESATSVKLSFYDYCDFGSNAISGQLMSYGSMQVMVSTNHGETYDYVWWSYGPKRYWRQHFVDLEEYIGQDIIIRFDYWYANLKPNFDWYVDDVSVEVFDNVFGGGSNVTEGSWDDPNMWGGNSKSRGLPTANDNVLISANVTIPENFVAEANKVVLNLDTVAGVKYGKIIIADGGQLKVNNPVEATVEKTIMPWTTNPVGGWYFIASPVNSNELKPKEVNNLLTTQTSAPYSYDLYRLNGTEWENYHAHNTDQNPFYLENGMGYLYANESQKTLQFIGPIKVYDTQSNTVPVSEGWNLIGNPYTFDVYPSTSYYVMDGDRTQLDPQTKSSNVAVKPCEGIIVKANDSGTVAFSKEIQQSSSSFKGNLLMTVTQNEIIRGETSAKVVDKAIVSFDSGNDLEKFYFGEQKGNIYIPQDGKEYAIACAGRDAMHCVSTEIPVNFKAAENGTFMLTINPDEVEMNYLHLIDNLTGADVDLLVAPSYTFIAHNDDYASRFRLVFSAQNDAQTDDEFAFISNGEIIIVGDGIVQMIDMMGRIIVCGDARHCISIIGMTPGVYILRLINGNIVKNQKIIIE